MKNYWLDLDRFKAGDIVQLKSPWRLMTVSGFNGKFYDCMWLDMNGVLRNEKYLASSLEPMEVVDE